MKARHLILASLLFAEPASANRCPSSIGGQSVDDMISGAGGPLALAAAADAQVAEIDRWLVELEASRGQGVHEAQIEALRSQALVARQMNSDVATAARCRS